VDCKFEVMKKEKGLEQYYSGNDDWCDIVQMAKEDFWIDSEYQKNLLKVMKNQLDISMAIYARFKEGSIEWVSRKVPALGHITPLECLETTSLTKRLREALMRMP